MSSLPPPTQLHLQRLKATKLAWLGSKHRLLPKHVAFPRCCSVAVWPPVALPGPALLLRLALLLSSF